MTDRPNAVFTIYYGPRPIRKFYHRSQKMPRRVRSPWMVGVAINRDFDDWAPGVQRTLIGAMWATWRLYRRLSKEYATARDTRENQ